MQTDPIGYEDNVNLYGYVGQDPINGSDPTGTDRHELEFGVTVLGQEIGVSVNVDTETMEVGASASTGVGIGIGSDIGGSYTRTDSSERGNNAAITLEVKAEAELGVRAGDESSLVVNTETSLGSISASTNEGLQIEGPSAEASAVAGNERISGRTDQNSSQTPNSYGIAAEARVTGSVKVEGNVSLRSAYDAIRRWF